MKNTPTLYNMQYRIFFYLNTLFYYKKILFLHHFGSLAEWLGTGLQNRIRRFESARNLKKEAVSILKQPLLVLTIYSIILYISKSTTPTFQ